MSASSTVRWFIAALALCCAGCRPLDATQPIALVPATDWTGYEADVLADAAQCWNLQFGTQLYVDRNADIEQQVRVDYSDAVCLQANALTHPVVPVRVSVCPLSYLTRFHAERTHNLMTILLHELGHALGILEHAHNPHAVMAAANFVRPEAFADEDKALFRDGNAGALPTPGCEVDLPKEPPDYDKPYDPAAEGCACRTP